VGRGVAVMEASICVAVTDGFECRPANFKSRF
jgi:hypothetical protein